MDSRKVIPISPSPQPLTRTGKLSIIPPRRSIKDHIASKEGGMSATEREKRLRRFQVCPGKWGVWAQNRGQNRPVKSGFVQATLPL